MAGARGVVEAKVGERTYRLRCSIAAMSRVEERRGGTPFLRVLDEIVSEDGLPRYSRALVAFEELCRSGGTPPSEEDLESLLPGDSNALGNAVLDACVAVGLIKDPRQENGKKKKGTS